MAPKRSTRSTAAATTAATTTVTNAQLKAMIDQGVTAALAAHDADRSMNGDDNHNSGTCVRRNERAARECTYPDFMKCQPLNFKGTKGFVELTQWFEKMEIDAIEFETELMDKKIHTFAERQSEYKRKQIKTDKTSSKTKQNTTWLSTTNANTTNSQRGTGAGQKPTCYECGAQGHFKKECPKLKNNNRDNQGGNGNALAKVYAVGLQGQTQTQTSLRVHHYYDVELADGRIIRLNAIIRGCTLPFNIDLMPVELGSLDVIIGMDWLAKYQAVIVCAEKIVRIPWGNETLIVHGDGSDRGNKTRLNIISCTKTQKYMLKGCPIFLAHVTTKETEDNSEKKLLEDVLIVQNFPEVFLEDLLGLPPTRQVEF
ncbi:putative reverse transcriptase domain-containing protein [Tanacetum coccineum]